MMLFWPIPFFFRKTVWKSEQDILQKWIFCVKWEKKFRHFSLEKPDGKENMVWMKWFFWVYCSFNLWWNFFVICAVGLSGTMCSLFLILFIKSYMFFAAAVRTTWRMWLRCSVFNKTHMFSTSHPSVTDVYGV